MGKLEKHILKYGLITSGALIVFFLLMRLLGLAEITELRSLNAIIMFSGVFLSIKTYRNGEFEEGFNYLAGIASGFFTGMVTAVTFALFVGIYVYYDPVFLAAIVADNPQKDFLNPLTSAMVIFMEAIASGFFFSYASMQFLKQDKTIPLKKAAQ